MKGEQQKHGGYRSDEREEKKGELTCAWKQKPRHGVAVFVQPQQLRIQGRCRHYTDELIPTASTSTRRRRHGRCHNITHARSIPKYTRASMVAASSRRGCQIVGGDSPPDSTRKRSGAGGSERQIDTDRKMRHRALCRSRHVASPRTAGVSRSVAVTGGDIITTGIARGLGLGFVPSERGGK
jgi:hypothetical protein